MHIPDKKEHKSHILVVDDDRRIRQLVARYLAENDFIAMVADGAESAEKIMAYCTFDALVLDVMMPQKTGMEFTQELRAKGITTPVILLTALSETEDRIDGLESGADDYLSKPFEPKELVLRLKAILRRTRKKEEKQNIFRIGELTFNPKYNELLDENKVPIKLTTVEGNLLSALTQSAGQVISRQELAERCGIEAGERTIDVQMTRLRRKVEQDPKTPRFLQTIRGKGYMLRTNSAKDEQANV